MIAGAVRRSAILLLPAMLGGCAGAQSALDAAGLEAERIELLSWILFAFCGAVMLAVTVIAALALFGSPSIRARIAGEWLVVWLGIAFPLVSLSVLLVYGIVVMGQAEAQPAGADADIVVTGERWWWRVEYRNGFPEPIDSANEIRIPVGKPVRIALVSDNVIHSFWVPRLAGKLDMIPGRVNVQTLIATRPGLSRGQCAEYCGGAHALMAFWVVAMEEEDYAAWQAREGAPADPPDDPQEAWGQELVIRSGCGACHTVRGTPATGTVGPDLTHVGSRHSLAAGALPNDAEAFARWIVDNQHVKPENLMPPYEIFSKEELSALAAYLDGLR